MVTFFQARIVLATFIHIKNISAVIDFDETLKVGSWEHLEQISTVRVTFVQATFVLTIFVKISSQHQSVSKLNTSDQSLVYCYSQIKFEFVLLIHDNLFEYN